MEEMEYKKEKEEPWLDITDRGYSAVPYQTGWVCPKCGSVYGPMHSECSRCNPPMKFEATC
jgi:uncharacterized OB-fold protein